MLIAENNATVVAHEHLAQFNLPCQEPNIAQYVIRQ